LNGSFYGKQDINGNFVPYLAATKDANLGVYGLKAEDLNGVRIGAVDFYVTKIKATSDINTQRDVNARQITGSKFKMHDANSVYGLNSAAFGKGSTAYGINSVAMGDRTTASGQDSFAVGERTKAYGDQSAAFGYTSVASGPYSISFTGTASETGAMAFGGATIASGLYSIAMGSGSLANNTGSIAMGIYPYASGYGSIAMGYSCYDPGCGFTYKLRATNSGSIAIGYADTTNDKMMSTGKGSVALGYSTQSTGLGSLAVGYRTLASGNYSTALDYNTVAEGAQSVAMGYLSKALGEGSVAIGYNVINSDVNSVALGRDVNVAGDLNVNGEICTIGNAYLANTNVSGNLNVDTNYGAYGELWQSYTVRTQVFPALNTYIQINGDWNAGDFYNTTLSPDENRITVNQNGMYLISVSGDFDTSVNAQIEFAVFVNGAFPESDMDMHIKADIASGANGALSLSGLKRLNAGDYIDLRAEQVSGTLSTMTFNNMNLKAIRIG
jgi:hypothetical protein